jgi:ligand-binding sensor domain-containing protein
VLFIVPFFPTQICFAQISDMRFRHISNEQGLSNSFVNAIFQDSRGFMWFATRDGLNRYDGVKVIVYKNNPNDRTTISDNYINTIYEDADHEIWVGTQYGLNRFNPVTNTFTTYSLGNTYKKGVPSNSVKVICGSDNDNICVGSSGTGFNILNFRTKQIRHFQRDYKNHTGLSGDTIHSLFKDNHNNLWIDTIKGLDLLTPGASTVKPFLLNGVDNNADVMSVSEDHQNNLWIGFGQLGVAVYNLTDKKVRTYTHVDNDPNSLSGNLILQIHCDRKGDIWIGTVNQGLNLFNAANNSFFKYRPRPDNGGSLSGLSVSSIYDDNQNNLWIGVHRGRINLYTANADMFKVYRQGLSPTILNYSDIKTFFEDKKGRLWLATDGGLDLFDRKNETFKRFNNVPRDPESLSTDAVQDIREDALGNLWVGTWGGGIEILNPETGKFKRLKANLLV